MMTIRARGTRSRIDTEERDGAPDAELVGRALDGERPAAAELYQRHVAAIYDYCAHRLGSREAAEDATQAVFLRAIGSLGRCRRPDTFRNWLYGIAHHVVIDTYRTGQHAGVSLDFAAQVEDGAPSPERLAFASEEHDRVQRVRAQLSPGEMALFDLLQQELTDTEIAAILGKRHGAVRTAHFRLRRTLRGLLGDVPSEGRDAP